MTLSRSLAWLAAAGLLAACVTINIYFPAAAAEKAADRIIRDVWGEQPGKPPTAPGKAAPPEPPPSKPPPSKPPPSTPDGAIPGASGLAERLPALLGVGAAQAQADINISTPAINALQAAMKARHTRLEPHYASGGVGLTRDALVTIRSLEVIPLAERGRVRQWVAEENRDRNALYREIASANGHPEWEPQIRSTFAERWVANARPGWWYQDAGGGWKQK